MPLTPLNGFTKLISDLTDKPNMSASDLKAYFDSSPEEVRVALNAVITVLKSTTSGDSGANNIGITSIDGSPTDLQSAFEWLKAQIDTTVLGQIPDGSITPLKLSTDAKKASVISVQDTSGYFAATTVEGVLSELFQFADNGKKDIVSVIGSPAVNSDTFAQLKTHIQNNKNTLATNLTNKGQSSVGSETLTALVDKVASVNTGKKWASGTISASTSPLLVSGLDFRPSVVIVYGYNYVNSTFHHTRQTFIDPSLGRAGYESQHNLMNDTINRVQGTSNQIYGTTYPMTINNDGFSATLVIDGSTPYNWIAFE